MTPSRDTPESHPMEDVDEARSDSPRPISRRALLAGGAVAIGGAVLHTAADALSQVPRGTGPQDAPDPT
ncbi:MAG: hypothetical protein ACOC8K_07895, partial [Gemmatimonadota bacterium]